MTHFQGFATKEEAKAFTKKNGGLLCYEKDEKGKGYHADDYRLVL